MPSVRILLLSYLGAQPSALWGMKDIFEYADSRARALSAVRFDVRITDCPQLPADVVILPPALSTEPPVAPEGWTDTLKAQHASGAVLASVCSGAFLLGETGLLDVRRVTTHWRHAPVFRVKVPKAIVDTRPLISDGGDIITAGGVMAWTDLTPHIIARFGGPQLMLDVARMFVLDPPDREQSYYAAFLPVLSQDDPQIAAVQTCMHRTFAEHHDVASLARRAGMSERTFLRRFKTATGLTPIAYLQELRVDAARSRLELSRDSVEQIAWDVGYQDPNAFRRVFKRIVGLRPAAYRRRFGQAAPSPGR